MSDILFTDKQQIGFTELKCDIEYRYVPKEDYQMLIDLAWRKGEHTAKKYRNMYPCIRSPYQLAQKLGGKVVQKENGPERIFSEYYSKRRAIRIFLNSINRKFVPANKNKLTSTELSHVQEIFIAHELFHHLECNEPEVGLTYKEYYVTVLKFGPLKRKVGLRSLSEIGAHSFTRTYLGIEDRF